jgi:putative transposase
MQQKRAYKYRFYPTAEQKHVLARTFGCARFVYNWALRQKTDAFYQQNKRLSYQDLAESLTDLKQQHAYSWLAEVSSVPLQQALRHLEKAFLNFLPGTCQVSYVQEATSSAVCYLYVQCFQVGWDEAFPGKDD